MSSPRALIAGIVHESSTYMVDITGPTRRSDFDVHRGSDLVREFTGTNTVTGGYLAACRRLGIEPVPALHARAEPGAAVAPETFLELRTELAQRICASRPVDLVLLDLHGAGALVTGESLDLAVVRLVRELVGPGVPIAVTVDLHANLPTPMVDLLDVLVGFLEYPHTDMAARAELAGTLAIDQARGGLAPEIRMLSLPMLVPPSTTVSGPGAWLRDLAIEAQAEPGVLACTVLHGYPYADTAHAGTSVVTVGLGPAADEANRRIARLWWDNRESFRIAPVTPEEAVAAAQAASSRPVVIGDGTDNPGCGATGDSTHLLRALLDSGSRACLATVHDPDTVRRCVSAGAGAEVQVELGGRHGWASGPPVRGAATVHAITDGRVVQRTMRAGKSLDFGLSVRLSMGAVDIVVSSLRRQVFDPEILLLHGAVPERYDVVAVKSVNHFRAGFARVSDVLLVADSPGPLTRQIDTLPRGPATGMLWPMNPRAVFDAAPVGRTPMPTNGGGM